MSGRFVWYELMTTDTKAAIAFYSEVIGWKTEAFPNPAGGGEPYMMWVGSQGPLGGVMPLPEEAKKMGAPPHWMAHVEVENVDRTVEQVKAKGGKIHVPPMDIPTVGRFSVIADPQGAAISVFQPQGEMKPHDTTKPGEVSWNELMTTDYKAAFAFYSELFGWSQQQEEMDMGPAGKYRMYGKGDQMYGGMMNKPADVAMPPAWIYYINVDDLDAAITRATTKGATKIYGPQEVPGGTRVAQLIDPQGAVFALHGPGKK
jgi:predicted enzyme related to lactoylglutathione lyase